MFIRIALTTLILFVTCFAWADTPAEPAPDFSWMPGAYAPPESKFATKYFTPEIRVDTAYNYDFSNPSDHTISGSSEVFRSGEVQLTEIGLGGDFNYENVGARIMTQFGMYSTTTPRNDPSPSRGQWQMDNAYRYLSEAYASYHIDSMKGINIQAGLFMSFIGLWSYHNFDNWTYQPSFVSSNTPWFFSGLRAQFFLNDKLKLEYWLINGWQSYGMFNEQPGTGVQVAYKPTGYLSIVANQYVGADTLGTPGRQRYHSDDSVSIKYLDSPSKLVSKGAFTVTGDIGCEQGGGVDCGGQYFYGFMAYNRFWFLQDHYGLTFGGGAIRNPGRYLVLIPPINGATAATGSPYFSQEPGDDFQAWDVQVTTDYMPTRNVTFRLEYTHRAASIPYFAGPNGMTPPSNLTNNGPTQPVSGWSPDLVRTEDRVTAAMMVRL